MDASLRSHDFTLHPQLCPVSRCAGIERERRHCGFQGLCHYATLDDALAAKNRYAEKKGFSSFSEGFRIDLVFPCDNDRNKDSCHRAKKLRKKCANSEAGERREMAHMFYDLLHGM